MIFVTSAGFKTARSFIFSNSSLIFSGHLSNGRSTFCDDKILIETDSPYLSPIPFRGKRNEPSYIVNTVKKGAEIFSISPNSFSGATSKNFNRLFKKVTS